MRGISMFGMTCMEMYMCGMCMLCDADFPMCFLPAKERS